MTGMLKKAYRLISGRRGRDHRGIWPRPIIVLACGTILAMILAVRSALYPFLAVSEAVPGGIIAIEGWIPDIDVDETVGKLDRTQKQDIYLLLGYRAADRAREPSGDTAGRLADKLRISGIPDERVQTVIYEAPKTNKTYRMASALKERLRASGTRAEAVNVITMGAHARRSRALFQMAFGKEIRIGVIPTRDPGYDPDRWWRTRYGRRSLFKQGAAYLYVKLLFRPKAGPGSRQRSGPLLSDERRAEDRRLDLDTTPSRPAGR